MAQTIKTAEEFFGAVLDIGESLNVECIQSLCSSLAHRIVNQGSFNQRLR